MVELVCQAEAAERNRLMLVDLLATLSALSPTSSGPFWGFMAFLSLVGAEMSGQELLV